MCVRLFASTPSMLSVRPDVFSRTTPDLSANFHHMFELPVFRLAFRIPQGRSPEIQCQGPGVDPNVNFCGTSGERGRQLVHKSFVVPASQSNLAQQLQQPQFPRFLHWSPIIVCVLSAVCLGPVSGTVFVGAGPGDPKTGSGDSVAGFGVPKAAPGILNPPRVFWEPDSQPPRRP